ncbi:MAG: OmpH family outer membrane protein [Salinivirgaceae bacterium]|nr:OmpH family outer membrane protein [Salinivirgaceae bacterium]
MKTNSIFACAIAVVAMGLFATSCANQTQAPAAVAANDSTAVGACDIAFIDVDSILVNYKLAIELNDAFMKKSANMENKLRRDADALQKDIETFQDKVQKGIFLTTQRAEEEQQRLLMRQQEFQKLQDEYNGQLAAEQQNMTSQLFEKISEYVVKYNTPERYKFILTRTIGGSMWYANESYNITNDIIEGLNAEYDANKKK